MRAALADTSWVRNEKIFLGSLTPFTKKVTSMYSFTAQQRFSALIWLSLFHIAIITSSNYLVQLPVSIFGFHTTWGAFTFPFIFLATDLTVRIFGAPLARRIILSVMVPALAISYVISALYFEAEWQGFAALSSLNIMVARIATDRKS